MTKKASMAVDMAPYLALAVLALIGVTIIFLRYSGEGSKTIDAVTQGIKPEAGLFDIRDLSDKEKEKCASLTNPTACMGTKTGCFWGKTNSGLGCFSCKNNKYFGENFGKCEGYNLISVEPLCVLNPCNFVSRNLDAKKEGKCIFAEEASFNCL